MTQGFAQYNDPRHAPRVTSGAIFDPWDAFVAPDFPLDILPPVVQQWVVEQSEVIGCDPNALAMAALANFSAALDHRFSLKLMRNGNWWASPRLWVLLVGLPSYKKSPSMNAATRDLEELQGERWDDWERELAAHKAAGGSDDSAPPKPPRYVIGDTTTEKLAELLGRHDRGTLVRRDEISGWLGSMERYSGRGGSADRAFWLQAFDGGPFTVDRISRGEMRIKNLSTSLLGGIQPERLKEIGSGLTSDGLLQRFLPVMLRQPRLPRDLDIGSVHEQYRALTRLLTSLPPEKLIMSDDALGVAEDLRRYLFDLEQASVGMAAGFAAFVGKLQGLAGSLTLILHLIEDPSHGRFDRVTAATFQKADRLVRDFIVPHAMEFYRTSETVTDGDKLQKIASWILTSGKTRIVMSDFTTNVAPLRGLTLFDLNKAISPLIAGGWLTALDNAPISKAWQVTPDVFDLMAERMEAESRRKAALATLVRGKRGNANA